MPSTSFSVRNIGKLLTLFPCIFVLPSAIDCHISQVKKHVISLFTLSGFGILWREIIYLSFSGIDLICLFCYLQTHLNPYLSQSKVFPFSSLGE